VRPRIAIPIPHSGDADYAARSYPQYAHAVELAGGEAVPIPLDREPSEVSELAATCHGILLPGSRADVDPAKYKAEPHPETTEFDAKRDTVDSLLLDDAYRGRKPILGICYGLQSLNVYRGGTLIQHIPDFLPSEKRGINHDAGRKVAVAHTVNLGRGSLLEKVTGGGTEPATIAVNSSHHQSAGIAGEGLRIAAHCPDDDIVEAVEGTSPDHFVMAVQWHPERTVEVDEPSRRIFEALVRAAKESGPKR
jgi:putative glutamine amidotransferase